MRRRGRPRIEIEREQLEFLVEAGFQVKDIPAIVCCSRRTIERRMQEFSIRRCDYTALTDIQLDELVEHIVHLHPQCGQKTVSVV